jgi:hypothetical protein
MSFVCQITRPSITPFGKSIVSAVYTFQSAVIVGHVRRIISPSLKLGTCLQKRVVRRHHPPGPLGEELRALTSLVEGRASSGSIRRSTRRSAFSDVLFINFAAAY